MSEQYGKYVACDATKCSGCKACELACFYEHNKKNNNIGVSVGTIEVPVTPKVYVAYIEGGISAAIQCKHCEDSPCLNICSKNAISRVDGQIIVDESKCIGCKDCMLACPFGAIDMMEVYKDGKPVYQVDGVTALRAASKCDFCFENPMGPACVRVCPNEALRIVDPSLEKKEKNERAVKAMYDEAFNRKERK